MLPLEEFFHDLDKTWGASQKTRVRLNLIGSSALLLQTSYRRGTKDADVLEIPPLDENTSTALRNVAGKDTALHKRRGIYLDVVSSGVPFMPHPAIWHAAAFNSALSVIDVYALDVVDVVVSKLKRFNSNDREDVDAMVGLDRLPHDALVERFLAAVDWHRGDASAERIPHYVNNLHQVERDMLGVEETEIDLVGLRY